MKTFQLVSDYDDGVIKTFQLSRYLDMYWGSTYKGTVYVYGIRIPYTFLDQGFGDYVKLQFNAEEAEVQWRWHTQIDMDIVPQFYVEFDIEELNMHVEFAYSADDARPSISPVSKQMKWNAIPSMSTSSGLVMDITNATIRWESGFYDSNVESVNLINLYRPGRVTVSMDENFVAGQQSSITNTYDGLKFAPYFTAKYNGTTIFTGSLSIDATSKWTMTNYMVGNTITDQYDQVPIEMSARWRKWTAGDNVYTEEEIDGFTVSMEEEDFAPIFISKEVTDGAGYKTTYGGFVATQSLYDVVANVRAMYGATITEITVEACGEIYSATLHRGAFQYVTGAYYRYIEFDISPHVRTDKLRDVNDNTIVITATDSRGMSVSTTVTVTTLEWFMPMVVNAAVHRGTYSGGVFTPDDEGGYVKIEWSVKFAPVNNRNSRQLKITAPDGQHTESLTAYEQSGYRISEASTESSYSIVFTLTDSFATFVRTISLSTAGVAMDILRGGNGLGLGKVAELADTLDVNPEWDVRVYGMTLAEYIEYVVGQMNT